jgi:hypothetical protein
MFTKMLAAPDCQEKARVRYQPLEPVNMVVETPDGLRAIHGFGIGEILEVLEPRIILPVAVYTEKSCIELADGRCIVSWPYAARHQWIC